MPFQAIILEASPRLELGIRVLQTHALPLGYDAEFCYILRKSSAGEFLPLRGCSFRASIKARLKNGADDEARPLNASADAAARTRNTEILRRRISTASRLFLSILNKARLKNGADDEARPLNASADAAARTRNTEILRRRISTASRLFLSSLNKARLKNGADDEARTRYLHLGKVALYQMSYIRKSESRYYGFPVVPSVGIEPTTRGFSVLCSTN